MRCGRAKVGGDLIKASGSAGGGGWRSVPVLEMTLPWALE